MAGAATATLAWSDDRTTWTSDLRDGARLSPRRPVAGKLQAVAAHADGRLLLVTGDERRAVLRARLRPAGARAFGPAEPIADTRDAYDVLAEFSPGTGQPVVTVQRNETIPGQDRAAQAIISATRARRR